METFKFRFRSSFDESLMADAIVYLDKLREVHSELLKGKLYVRFTDGDRKGSIARLELDPAYRGGDKVPCIDRTYRHYSSDGPTYEIRNGMFNCIARWDKRSNKPKVPLGYSNSEMEVLIGYDGPTIWEKFDANAAREKLLENPDIRDIDGKKVEVGSKVMYINARYGDRLTLCHGTVDEFRVSVDSKGHSFATIVVEDGTTTESSLRHPESMLWVKS